MEEGLHFTLTKKERITGKNKIDNLFTNGKSFLKYPLKIVYIECESDSEYPASILISVPKKRLKLAFKRNKIKRLIREAYRLNKNTIVNDLLCSEKQINIAFVYVKDDLTDYETIERSMRKVLNELAVQLKTKEE
ncbi:MAG: ribonuclease P protein component [Dysgonamonadaceae bacterium]|jgi:ribonuclease P protein component|nr:ribonuclease P protein component [Dysgonamonadaceae bacterium]MDD3308456.1 ribonuclease P protein component [Dysgonamonadaceae bacterium]MDD3899682.1 ribonuclease P protein component [Dysgonamonadaceae bacterium]MDD4398195.1 ribonuclease P protein component [Dysgonamonadaceae bacterium]MEA5081815.1 ribonuclease P protein component [Dysgonamonadaceae bacterium]